jgi:SAM-dependent methyltransferase
LDRLLHGGDQGAWQLAALATALGGGQDPALAAAARVVLAALGLPEHAGDSSGATAEQLAHRAAAPLLQAAAVVSGQAAGWAQQSDEALLAQGRASAAGARAFAELALPHLGDLAARLNEPGGRILDVGTGVGALALAYAEQFPNAEVVGIDVSARALRLAESTLAGRSAARRVDLRQLDITDLEDPVGFDLAWIPAPFIPEPALREGVSRVAAVLRPGGWLMLGHGKYGAEPVEDALNRFKTVAYGGTPLTTAEATSLLTDAGFEPVINAPTPPGAPAVACARKA